MRLQSQIAAAAVALLVAAPLAVCQSRTEAKDIRVTQYGHFYLHFSRDGRLLRVIGDSPDEAGQKHHVRVVTYAAKTGAVVHIVNLPPDTDVYDSTSDGRTAVVIDNQSSERGHLSLLNTETGKLQPIPESWYEADEPDASISGDERLIAAYSEPAVESDTPMTVTVYDWASKTIVATRRSEYVSAGGAMGGGITEDGEVEFEGNRVGSTIVDLKTGRMLAQFGPSAARSPDGKWEVEFPDLNWDESRPTDVLLKDGMNGNVIGKLDMQIADEGQNLYGAFTGVFCGLSGRFIVTGPDRVAAYTLPSGKLLQTIPPQSWREHSGNSSGAVVACSADGTRVAIVSGARLTFHVLK